MAPPGPGRHFPTLPVPVLRWPARPCLSLSSPVRHCLVSGPARSVEIIIIALFLCVLHCVNPRWFRASSRAGEMIPEVGGGGGLSLGPWGPSRKMVPKCIKGPKTIYTTIAVAEKQSKRSRKGPFRYYIGSPPPVPPRRCINGARRGRSLPVHPGFSSHGQQTENVSFLSHTLNE